MSDYMKKQEKIESTLKELINLLPSTYNKETTDTNYYKLLRALSHELADAKVKIEEVSDNTYLDTVHPYAMYNNFGTLVKLSKSPDWDDEQYRRLIQGVIQSLLIGPTKDSLIQAFKHFTSFDIKVHELYKDMDQLDPSAYEGYNPKYTFILEIEKPVGVYSDIDTLRRDANYIIGILKPAHTIGLQIVNLTDSEDFRFYYAVDKQVHDLTKQLMGESVENKIYELVLRSFNEKAADYISLYNVKNSEALDMIYIENYGMTRLKYLTFLDEKAESLYNNYLNEFEQNMKELNLIERLEPTLTLDYFRNIATKVLREENDNTKRGIMLSNVQQQQGTAKFDIRATIVSGEDRKFSFIFNANYNSAFGYAIEIDEKNGAITLFDRSKQDDSGKCIKDSNGVVQCKLAENNAIGYLLTPGVAFNLQVEFIQSINSDSSGTVHVYLNNVKVLESDITNIKNRHYGFQSGRDLIEISSFQVNSVDISTIENNYNPSNSKSFWSIPNQKNKNTPSGIWYVRNGMKYLTVQGLLEKEFLDTFKQELFEESIEGFTLDDLNDKIEIEKQKLKNYAAKKGEDISLTPEYEWTDLTEKSMKNELLYNHIVESFGGLTELYNYKLSEASRFKEDFERFYRNNSPYIGMDKVMMEGDNINAESRYGWKHMSYKGQLMTSIDLDGPKIGSTCLIGPRYTLYDRYFIDADHKYNDLFDYQHAANRSAAKINRIILNSPLFALLPSEREDLEEYHVFGSGYEEVYNTQGIIEEFDHQFGFYFEDMFDFTRYRNAFRLNYDMLNDKPNLVLIDDEEVDVLNAMDVELKENVGVVNNVSAFILNLSTISSTKHVMGEPQFEVAEMVLSKVDSLGNEIIIEKKVI